MLKQLNFVHKSHSFKIALIPIECMRAQHNPICLFNKFYRFFFTSFLHWFVQKGLRVLAAIMHVNETRKKTSLLTSFSLYLFLNLYSSPFSFFFPVCPYFPVSFSLWCNPIDDIIAMQSHCKCIFSVFNTLHQPIEYVKCLLRFIHFTLYCFKWDSCKFSRFASRIYVFHCCLLHKYI